MIIIGLFLVALQSLYTPKHIYIFICVYISRLPQFDVLRGLASCETSRNEFTRVSSSLYISSKLFYVYILALFFFFAHSLVFIPRTVTHVPLLLYDDSTYIFIYYIHPWHITWPLQQLQHT